MVKRLMCKRQRGARPENKSHFYLPHSHMLGEDAVENGVDFAFHTFGERNQKSKVTPAKLVTSLTSDVAGLGSEEQVKGTQTLCLTHRGQRHTLFISDSDTSGQLVPRSKNYWKM